MKDWTGILRLEAENRLGKTVAKDIFFQGAFKVQRPHYYDGSGQACYYILNPGGGYLNGDRYKMEFLLNEQSELLLTTQSATKVYKTPTQPVYQETEISLKAGSYLEYIPDPLIAYRHARYKQKNIIRMEKGSTFLYTDILTPGWSPDGELFAYDMLQLKNEIYMDDRLVVYDHIKLNPLEQIIYEIGFMEGFTHLGSMIVIGEQVNAEFLDRLYESLEVNTSQYSVGLSLLPVPGFTLRVLAASTQQIESIFARCHQMIRQEWFNRKPVFLRKY
ncbi:urease accessory protein UreD [Scopulibacillus cellulosilyticus]|uniref:Urease accessory protein UreD n=1 Tax=Scopulibacillus cellulosilyticus TaxID=2665665 RepID=A0ABW2Q2Y4_9BACL